MTGLKTLLENEPSQEKAQPFLVKYNLPYTRTVLKNLRSIAESVSCSEEAELFLIKLLDQIKGSAHPVQALNQTERFFSQLETPEKVISTLKKNKKALRILCTLFGASPYLSGILVQKTDFFLWLIEDRIWNTQVERESLTREILKACSESKNIQEAYPVFRHVKQREMLRIGAKDLTEEADLTETVEALSTLAEASLEAAYQTVDRFVKMRYGTPLVEDDKGNLRECRFVILAMGKLGGAELNFSSDIDLLYLYESDKGETTGVSDARGGAQSKVDNHLYFVKLSEGITDLLHANTEDGFVFRVDLRLRPEGSHGPVASSLRSYEIYYESFGQTWERSALLKCRPVAGDIALGMEFKKTLRPFVYRKYLDYAAIDELKEMKQKILQELKQRPSRGVNIKLGRGGIREIEFFIQALQLIYGGRINWIRERNSLRALHRLCDKKLITYEVFSTLSKAYTFLRNVEHKLQIENQLQLQTLPKEKARVEQLARRCGAPDREAFLKELDLHRERVQEHFENLFYEKEESDTMEGSALNAILVGDAEQTEVYAHLSRLGFQDPLSAYKNIRLLRDGAPYFHTSSKSKTLFWKIAPHLLEEVSDSPDPDMALNNLERFVSGYGAREVFYGLLNENPPALKRIVSLFSMSSYLSNLLIRHPDYIETIFIEDQIPPTTTKEIFDTMMMELQKVPGAAKIDFLRRFKHLEEMKIGILDILTDTDLIKTSQSLSRLADACLEASYNMAFEELSGTYGTPHTSAGTPSQFAILGAGKLGSEELIYGSDLDLLFVYSEDGETSGPEKISNNDFFTRLAGRITAILTTMTAEGILYRVDLRLRPLGEGGPLVQSLAGFQDYFQGSLQPWERQALTRVRFCAGNPKSGKALLSLISKTLFAGPPLSGLNKEILKMRLRIEKEKARATEGVLYFKAGEGGVSDIEFLMQYLQLRHGGKRRELRSPKALQVLETAHRLGFLSEGDAGALKNAYMFLRRLESRVRIVQDLPITSLSSNPEKNRALALRMGYAGKGKTDPGRQLLDDYREITCKTREIFLRLLDDREPGQAKTPEK